MNEAQFPVISSTVLVAPVDGMVCGWKTKSPRSMSDGSESISKIFPTGKSRDVERFPN